MNISRRALLAVAAFALLPLVASSASAATTTVPDRGASAMSTGFDRAIDLYLQQQVSSGRLASKDAAMMREQLQMQFLSLSAADQQAVLEGAANLKGDERVSATIDALNNAVQSAARRMVAELTADTSKTRTSQSQITPKLGGVGPDLVYVATAGPCRVFDSRFGPGMLPGGTPRQIYAWSSFAGYSWATGDNQGGTGTAGSGNCVGTVYPSLPSPVAVVATITVLNTTSAGALQAWDGGTNLTTGAALAWNAGDRLSNTTVVPVDRTVAPFVGSGFKRDFGVNNNSPTPIDIVVDVVGYMIMNTATALECLTNTNTSTTTTSVDVIMAAAACPAGYTATGINCASSAVGGDFVKVIKSFTSPLGGGPPTTGTCRFENTGGLSTTYWGYLTCCRVPGR